MFKKILFMVIIISIFLAYFVPVKYKNFVKEIQSNKEILEQYEVVKNHPLKKISVNGLEWYYYIKRPENVKKPKTILFLHGMTGSYDIWWQQLYEFQKNYIVVSYTLPQKVDSLKKVEEGIFTILEQEQLEQIILVGTSMGGYIAQYLTNYYPEKIIGAVFSNTFPPNPIIKKENDLKSKFLRLIPEILFYRFFVSNIKNQILPTSDNSQILKGFLLSLPITKKQFLNRYKIITEEFNINRENKVVLIPKLIIESENDPLIKPELRYRLKEIYKEAKVTTFSDKGHFPYVIDASTYNHILYDFINNIN